MTYAYIYTVFV